MDDLSNPTDVKRIAKDARQADLVRQEIIRGIMSLPQGRGWMYGLLERCHVFQTTFTGKSLSMAFQEGERNIGLELIQDVMAACPDQYVAMIREAQSNEWSTRQQPRTGLNGNVDQPSADYTGDYDDSDAYGVGPGFYTDPAGTVG